MLTTLPVSAFAVERVADRFGFGLDLSPLASAASLELRVGDLDVSLRLIGAGHQVVAGPVVETVAALPELPGPLPYGLQREVGGWTHRFTADVYRRGHVDFDHAVAFLRRYLADRDDALVGVCDGVLSGLLLRPVRRGLDWRGWHTFPATRQIVVTRTRMLIG